METIREYLNNLFLGFPDTPAVLRAKAELLEMMEDKYDECIREGKSEKEAVGTVISEFGNIEEIAEELGIEEDLRRSREERDEANGQDGIASEPQPDGMNGFAKKQDPAGARTGDSGKMQGGVLVLWKLEQAKEYVSYTWKHAWMVAIGVACFILSCFLNSVIDDVGRSRFVNAEAAEFFGDFLFFIGILVGIVICSQAKRLKKSCPVLIRGNTLQTDEEAGTFMQEKREADEKRTYGMRLLGVILLIFGLFPPTVAWLIRISWISDFLDNSFLLFAAVSVMLFIVAGSVENRYKEFARSAYFDRDAAGSGDGFVSGEKVFEGKRKKKGNPVLIGILIGVAVLLFLGVMIGGSWFVYHRSGKSSEDYEVKVSKSYAADAVKEIQIDLDTEDFVIESGDVSQVKVDYSGHQNIRQELNSDGSLVVKSQERHSFFVFNFFWMRSEGGVLRITVPKEDMDLSGKYQMSDTEIHNLTKDKRKITADLDTGDIQVRGIAGTDFELSTDTGNIDLEDVEGRKMELDADTGDLSLVNVLGNVFEADADTGSVTMKSSFFQTTHCDLDTGSFYMSVPMEQEEFCTTFQADFSMELENKVDFFGNDVSAQEVSGMCREGRCIMKVSTDVGGIEVEQER